MDQLTTISPDLLTFTAEHFRALMPYVWGILGAIAITLACVVRVFNPKWLVFFITLFVGTGGALAAWNLLDTTSMTLFNGMMVSDPFSNFFAFVALASVVITALASFKYLDKENLQHPEYFALLIFSAIGMMMMASSLDLIVLFIALELMSLSVYVLVGFRRADRKSNEASMKYFILGGAASAVLLYGAALLYGATASTNIKDILQFAQTNGGQVPALFVLGGGMLIIGFLFKVAAVPFHMWMPDVYEGAPAPITGFMTTGLKAASFAAFVRVFVSVGYSKGLAETLHLSIHHLFWVAAVLTMVIGNVIALTQVNLKRMLAYSSIAHTGYLMVGILAAPMSEQGFSPVILYLVTYAIMNLGAFAVLSVLSGPSDQGLCLHDLAGVAKQKPLLGLAMAVFMFSMAGLPPTAGFIGKYLLFYSAIQAGEIWLVVISVLCSAISLYYYLRVLVYMYMRDPVSTFGPSRIPVWSAIAVAGMATLTLQIGMLPEFLVEAAKKAVIGL